MSGLSNWRLDPAKMNRSVCLARPDPDSAEVGRTGHRRCQGLGVVLGSQKSKAEEARRGLLGMFLGDLDIKKFWEEARL